MSKKVRTNRQGRKNRRAKAERELPVFVYGTLLPGFGNYKWHLEGHTLFEEKATIQGRMYDYCGHYPVVDVKELGTIKGMVMHIKPGVFNQVLDSLDCLEGYTPGSKNNLYNRVTVKAKTVHGDEIECYTYSMGAMFRSEANILPPIEDGDWAEFKSMSKPTVVLNKDTVKFEAKQAVMTNGISTLLDMAQVAELLGRHYSGDWGECEEDSVKINNKALESGEDSLLSVFKVDAHTVWVYTEWDRSVTTIMLPSEW